MLKIGDKVIIVDRTKTYSCFKGKAEDLKADMSKWDYNTLPDN